MIQLILKTQSYIISNNTAYVNPIKYIAKYKHVGCRLNKKSDSDHNAPSHCLTIETKHSPTLHINIKYKLI